MTHPRLPALSSERKRSEIEGSKHFLEDNLGLEVGSFSYPFGQCDAESLEIVASAGLKRAVVARPDELIGDPQLLARNMIERHPHPILGEVVFHGNPLKLSDTEPRKIALAPDLAQHNREVYGEIGLDDADLDRLAAAKVI